MARNVFVYQGLGVSETGFKQLYTSLKRYFDSRPNYSVLAISADEIITGNSLDSAYLVAFGGGFTSGFARALGDEGIARLKSYVDNGGSYLGVGAGGYFGCDYIEFDKGGPLEKFAERDLRFYQGVGEGPAYPGFEYGTDKGVHAVPVHFKSDRCQETFHAYLDGGGMFAPRDPPKLGSKVTEVKVIASFLDLPDKPAAIVHTRVGKGGGRVVLSGVHLEYDTLSILDSNPSPSLACLKSLFENSVGSQRTAFTAVMDLLGCGLDSDSNR